MSIRSRSALVLLLAVMAGTGAGVPAQAQMTMATPDSAAAGTFINPFPESDIYRLQVYGESMAEGLLGGLVDALGKETKVQVNKKARQFSTLIKGDITEEAKAIEAELEREAPQIAVIMPNMTMRFPWREGFDRRFPPGSEARREEIERRRAAWKAEYGQRVDRLMRAFKRKNVAVYWVGLPIMRNPFTSDDAQVVNEMLRERSIINGSRFIDIYAGFADEENAYNASGPDVDGKPKVLRSEDGIQFTGSGYRKLAHFVERELKRDLAVAQTERSVPLAGSEEEQRRVRPTSTVPVAALAKGPAAAAGQVASAKDAKPSAQGVRGGVDSGSGDLRADNSRIALKTVNLQGKEDNITIEILRPSIPASVLAAVTRRGSADKAVQIGDPVMTEIQGGQTVISTVTPIAEAGTGGDRRRAGQSSPFHLVLERGERLAPKAGRSDDLPWPRQELPPAVAKVDKEPARTAPGPRPAPKPRG